MRNPTFLRLGLALAFALSAALFSSAAFADKATETQAKALEKKAMDEDYLSTDFSKAADKLNKAIALCGSDKCSPTVRAQLKRDLGVVDIGGQLDKDAGMAAFVEAVKLDGSLALDPDLKTKDLEAAWEAAKKKAGGGGKSDGGAATPPAGGGEVPSGDFNHSPTLEQAVRTPVPIYAEYTGSETLVRVIARYKAFGMTEFKPLELKKIGNGWGATVPCADVLQGSLQYYLQGFNAQNDPIATAGDRNNTFKVPVKTKIDGDPPHLPDQPPPTQCADKGDCPPGFPCAKAGAATGGTEEGGTKAEGEECEESNECKSNECKAGKCTAPPDANKFPRIWVGVSGSLDLATFVSSDQDVCAISNSGLPVNTSGYYCTNSDGSNYPNRSYDGDKQGVQSSRLTPGKAGSVNGGSVIGNFRVDLAFDYAITRNILAGARLGYVLGRYPGSAFGQDGGTTIPIHAEARFTYLFFPGGVTALVTPYAFVAVGASEYDGEVDVPVSETPSTSGPFGSTSGGCAPAGAPAGCNAPAQSKTVQAWKIAGPGFGALGGGVRVAFPMGKEKKMYGAVMVAPKLVYALGNGGLFAIEPEAAFQLGF